MKKNLFLFTVLILGTQLKSQIWCAPGATWHYRNNFPYTPYFDGYVKLVVTNTVTINSIVCQNMVGTFYGQTISSSSPTTTINNFVNINTYENNKIVYMYNPFSLLFDTIANFNANIGDKWLSILYPNNPSNCQSNYHRPTITVIDTGHVIINSLNLRKIQVSVQINSAFSHSLNMIEKIGGVTKFLFDYDQCIVDGPVYGNFVCYSDNNFPLYDPSSSICNYVPTSIGIQESNIAKNALTFYPNPNNGNFNLTLKQASHLKIYNALGSLVYEKEFKDAGNFQINISHFAPGIYQVQAENLSGISYSKLIKE